jgi:endonuclease G, mitochondrial
LSLITKEQREEIEDLAVAAGLFDPQYRGSLLDGIDPGAAGFIPVNNPPRLQLQIDLGWVTDTERIANGAVPLLIWLKNAARLRRTFADGPSFRRWADYVSGLAGGEPLLAMQRGAEPDSPLVVTLGTTRVALPELKEAVLFDKDAFVPFEFLSGGERAGRSVAHLSVPVYEQGKPVKTESGAESLFSGTGWVLGKRYVITNHHVINARRQGAREASEEDFLKQGSHTRIRFDFDDQDALGEQVLSAAVVAWNAALDYAVLKTCGEHGRPPLRRISGRFAKTSDHIPVNIIQHPDGGPKMLALRNNLVTDSTERDVCYLTDTKLGSSGSPVFSDQWSVVALHRGSVIAEGVRYFGASTAWVNIGTQVASIEDDLKQKFPAVWADLQ